MGCDRHLVFIIVLDPFTLTECSFLFVFCLEEVFGALAPGPIMVFVKNDAIPVEDMHPLILGLDSASIVVLAEIVLKRAEANKRLLLVGLFIRQTTGRNELPTTEIDMLFQVVF